MEKKHLIDGMGVEIRGGNRYIVWDNKLQSDSCPSICIDLATYNDNLTHKRFKAYDIVKIFKPFAGAPFWERKENILDEVERKYLKGVIKPFKKQVNFILKQKCEWSIIDNDSEFITIDYNNSIYSVVLPPFKSGTMYKGMKQNKRYTLKELKL